MDCVDSFGCASTGKLSYINTINIKLLCVYANSNYNRMRILLTSAMHFTRRPLEAVDLSAGLRCRRDVVDLSAGLRCRRDAPFIAINVTFTAAIVI